MRHLAPFRAGGACICLTLQQGKTVIVTPVKIARPDHSISRASISENSLKVLYRLKNAGFRALLVGGGVRDLLLGREPKDFDIATDARPEEIRQLFRNCRLIGRRFRLAHVHFGREIVEVATFRAPHRPDADGQRDADNGMLVRDNVYGTIEEDALRRDFTVNALYYDIDDFSVIDYAQGMQDLQAGKLRLLGDPERRYREDPVRMIRAVRFAAKLGFSVALESETPLFQLGHLLEQVPSARLFEEVLKLFHGGTALETFEKLRHYDLFRYLFPETDHCLEREDEGFPLTLVSRGLHNTDLRIQQNKPVTPAFLFAILLWEPVRQGVEQLTAEGVSHFDSVHHAGGEVLARQQQRVAIPRRFSLPMREIWALQHRLDRQQGKRALRLLGHPRFRAAYDFLLLRAEAGEADPAVARWWTEFQSEHAGDSPVAEAPAKRRRRRRRKAQSPAVHDS
jgi:poly(A) polymerase